MLTVKKNSSKIKSIKLFERGYNMIKISLRAARVNAELTQDNAAKALGISHSTLVKWEKHPDIIPAYRWKIISELYRIPVECLLFLPND